MDPKTKTVLSISTRLAGSIALSMAFASNTQAAIFQIASASISAENSEPHLADFGTMLGNTHSEIDNARHIATELIGLLNDQHVIDPAALDGRIDFDQLKLQLSAMGMISATDDTWTAVSSMIEADGMPGFIAEVEKRLAAFDKMIYTSSSAIEDWIDSDTSVDDLVLNTDKNPLPAINKISASAAELNSFSQLGLIILAQAAYIDQGTSLTNEPTAVGEDVKQDDALSTAA